MECPDCPSQQLRKNGNRRGKPNHICVSCGRQFVSNPQAQPGYSDDARQICLMYVNGMGFQGRERVTRIHHTTVIRWVMQVGKQLPDAYGHSEIPEVGELDELPTFIGSKKKPIWIGTAVNHFQPGI